jgi:peptide/nickel transport system permease protein
MSRIRQLAVGFLVLVFCLSLFADLLAPAFYGTQFRESPNATSCSRFPLGTDELGRDRLSRLLYGSRISLLLAPTAALLATLMAAVIGGIAGYWGKGWERLAVILTDLFLSLPWVFLLLTVRALLPLNVSPTVSVVITFTLLGVLGWAASARIVRARARSLRNSEFVLQAHGAGYCRSRVFFIQVLPNLKPVLTAQFWVLVPTFILAEANLGLLGLGVAEPLPSWGNLLRELENYSAIKSNPWLLAPLVLLLVVVGCFQLILSQQEQFQ